MKKLPAELLHMIASEIHPSSLVNFALTCHAAHEASKPNFPTPALLRPLRLRRGFAQVALPRLLVLILTDPRRAKFVLAYHQESDLVYDSDSYHEDSEMFHDQSEGEDGEDSDKSESKALPNPRREPQTYGVLRRKLQSLLQTSRLVPESMRKGLVEALTKSTEHPCLLGLLLILCTNLERFDMSAGQFAGRVLLLIPESLIRCLAPVKKIETDVYGHQEVCARLEGFAPFLRLKSLEELTFSAAFHDEDDGTINIPENTFCNLRYLSMHDCQIDPTTLGKFLSAVKKTDRENNSHTQSRLSVLRYIHGWGMMSPEDVNSIHFQAIEYIRGIREQVGNNLEKLHLECSEDHWTFEYTNHGDHWISDYTDYDFNRITENADCDDDDDDDCTCWGLSSEVNLRIGFMKLEEITIGMEMLVCGWLCPISDKRDGRPETLDSDANQLPLSTLLPQTLRILRLLGGCRINALRSLVVRKLISHMEFELQETPHLCHIDLSELFVPPDEEHGIREDLQTLKRICEEKKVAITLSSY